MDKIQITHLLRLQEASNQGKLVVFVGAGVSANSGVPTWKNLTDAFKQELPDDIQKETDVLKVAQIYKNTRDKKDYYTKIRKVLRDGNVAYNPIHNAILQLNPAHIITTNYDNLIEQAIQANYKQYDIIRQDSDLPDYRYPNKVVKMHGDFSADNIVLAEEDYYNYGRDFPLIRSFVTSLFTTNVVLFIGFSFDDLNLKVILNEIKTILDENMQRVYLLTDEHVDKEMHEYYEKKGINVVSITNPDDYIKEYGIDINPIETKKLNHPKGVNLYKQLHIIKFFDKNHNDDLLKILSEKLKKTETELNVIGVGLKYLFPKKYVEYWEFYYNGLRLGSSYFSKLAQKLKTISGKRQFVSLYPQKERIFLLQEAYANQVFNIDGINIITEKNFKKIHDSFSEKLSVDAFYELDIAKLYNEMKLLKTQGMSYNKKDLYLPYILCRLGQYYEAYLLYKELLPKFWDKKLYVLYFISIYNLYNIRHAIANEVWNKKDVDTDSIVKEIERFDLDVILRKLPIDNDIKQTFVDLITLRYFSEKSNDAEELSRKIHIQKKQADRGGGSINGNIYSLVSKFLQTYNFCVSNCIEFNNSYFYSLIKDTASGILLSHATKNNKIGGILEPTRIEELDSAHLFVLLFFVNSYDLSEMLKQYDINEIVIKDESVIEVEKLITNLYKSLFIEDRFNKPDFGVQIVSSIIENMVILLGKSKTALSQDATNRLYKIIHNLWSQPIFRSVSKHLHLMVEKNKPSKEMAVDLLDDLIKSTPYDAITFARVISKQLKENRLLFDKINDTSVLFNDTDGQLGMVLYNVLPLKVQKDYVEYVQNNSKRLLIYLIILKNLNIGVDNIETFEELLKKPEFTTGFKKEQLTGTCWILAGFRKSALYSNVHSIIDDFGKKHEQYKFYLDPIGYKDVDKIETLWLLRLEDSILKQLINNNIIKERIKKSILSGKLEEKEVNMLIKIL